MNNITQALQTFSIRRLFNQTTDYSFKHGEDKSDIHPQEIIIKAKLIGSIKAGEKISPSLLEIQDDTYFTGLRRWRQGDSRRRVLAFFYDVMEKMLKILDVYIQSDRKQDQYFCVSLITDIYRSVKGIKATQETYADDQLYCKCIDTLIEYNINSKLGDYKEKYPSIFEMVQKEEEKSEITQTEIPPFEVEEKKIGVSNHTDKILKETIKSAISGVANKEEGISLKSFKEVTEVRSSTPADSSKLKKEKDK
jgi:hypothetical protein